MSRVVIPSGWQARKTASSRALARGGRPGLVMSSIRGCPSTRSRALPALASAGGVVTGVGASERPVVVRLACCGEGATPTHGRPVKLIELGRDR